jgi:integrase
MAIQIFCTTCKSTYSLDAKSCSKCGAIFGRDKKYRVCVSFKGKRVTRVVDNLTIARETEAAIKGDMVRGDYEIISKKKKVPTLNQVWARYLPYAQENKKSWKDDKWYYEKHISSRFGEKAMDAISPIDIERLKSDLKKGLNRQGKPYAQQTIKHQLAILRRLFNLARRWGLYPGENPMDQVELPQVDNQVTEFLKDEEISRLFQVLERWPCKESAALIKLALFTGLRKGEILRLTWEDVNFEQGMITLRKPKGGRTVTIPISPQALEVLKRLEPPSPTSSYVFPGPGGRQKTDFRWPWYKIRKAAGLPDNFRFHGLRHSFASILVSNGVEILVLGKLLTHKSTTMTQRYAHLAPGAIRNAALKSGDLLTPKPKLNVVKMDE